MNRMLEWAKGLEPDDLAHIQRLSGCSLPQYFRTHRV